MSEKGKRSCRPLTSHLSLMTPQRGRGMRGGKGREGRGEERGGEGCIDPLPGRGNLEHLRVIRGMDEGKG